MTQWITLTSRLQGGLRIISQLDNAKLRSLVNRICQSLHSGINEKAFSSEEEDKLLATLNVKRDELDLLIDTITFIYSRAAFGVVKPGIMESTMKESFSISEEKVSILVNAWITHAKTVIDVLRHKSIFPSQDSAESTHNDGKKVAVLMENNLTVEGSGILNMKNFTENIL